MGWIPIISVKKAEAKTIKRVTVITKAVGWPVAKLPDFLSKNRKAYLTGHIMKMR